MGDDLDTHRARGQPDDAGSDARRPIDIRPLYGDLSRADQDLAIQAASGGRRKVGLATNIAETVYYLVHGSAITDQRPKGDTTSSTPVALKRSAG